MGPQEVEGYVHGDMGHGVGLVEGAGVHEDNVVLVVVIVSMIVVVLVVVMVGVGLVGAVGSGRPYGDGQDEEGPDDAKLSVRDMANPSVTPGWWAQGCGRAGVTLVVFAWFFFLFGTCGAALLLAPLILFGGVGWQGPGSCQWLGRPPLPLLHAALLLLTAGPAFPGQCRGLWSSWFVGRPPGGLRLNLDKGGRDLADRRV